MATRRRATRSSLTGSISDLQRRVRYLQNKQTPTRLGNQSVVRSAIQPRAVGSDQIALNSIANDQIQEDAIKAAQLDEDSVTRDAIKNGEVVRGKLGTDSVERGNIIDGEVVDGKLGNASVNLVNMKPNSVDNDRLTTDSVNFRTIATNAVGNENMLGDSIGNAELQNNSVSNGNMQNDSVGFAELQSSSVGTTTLQNTSVTNSKLASGIDGGKLTNLSVTGLKIANSTITSGKINTATYAIIVRDGLSVGNGISKSGSTISASFGTGFNSVARGNHSHGTFVGASNSNVIVLSSNVARSTHRHQVNVLASSSLRYKKDITSHKILEPEKILNLDLKKYKYKNSKRAYHQNANQEWMYGYIAEEVHEMGFDEILGFDDDGNPDSINYGMVSVILLEVVKNQHKDIEEMKKRLTSLEEKK